MSEKKGGITVTQIICVAVAMIISFVVINGVLGIGGVLGGAIAGGLGALVGTLAYYNLFAKKENSANE